MKNITIALLAIIIIAAVSLGIIKCMPLKTVEGLIKTAEHGSYSSLEKALNSNEPKNRIHAVQALLYLQTDEALKVLKSATRDQNVIVRSALVQGLNKIPKKKALPLLLILLDDREFSIVREALKTVKSHTGKNYLYTFEATTEQKLKVILECKQDIQEETNK